jgi:type 1 glutamine amidotransferase
VKRILLVVKGHPYERQPFYDIFEAMDGVDYTLVEQPAAQALFNLREAAGYDAFVCYDMPGIQFHPDRAPDFAEPPRRYREGFEALLEAGHGFVFLHHAIAGWPAWERYAQIVGGRFHYMPARLRGRMCQDSGYRHGVTHTVRVLEDHPVTAGVPAEFEITDELYLSEVFEDDVQPLLASSYDFTAENFYSARKVVEERRMFDNEGWEHAPGSNLIGWCRTEGKSRIVYLQCGDDPVAYANPHFRRLLANAIGWVSERQQAG